MPLLPPLPQHMPYAATVSTLSFDSATSAPPPPPASYTRRRPLSRSDATRPLVPMPAMPPVKWSPDDATATTGKESLLKDEYDDEDDDEVDESAGKVRVGIRHAPG